MYCNFCNQEVPEDHVKTCPVCLGALHVCNGKMVCACCGRVTDVSVQAEAEVAKASAKRPKLMVEDAVIEETVEP